MKRLDSPQYPRRAAGCLAALVTAIYLVSGAVIIADQAKDAAATEKPSAKKTAKKLTGAELYAINCNRCHAERYPTEFNSAQWKTIMLHMRVRANLPAKQAKEILRYLQEESGN